MWFFAPKKDGSFLIGEITGDYSFVANSELPHQRSVKWYSKTTSKDAMSGDLRTLAGGGWVRDISEHSRELENLISDNPIISTRKEIEDPISFAMEKHLENFLVENWKQTDFGKHYDIWKEAEESGQQFPTDTGRLDILAISKDKKRLLVIELKKGKASDTVVGQIQRYMGYVKQNLADQNQEVKGIIIALKDDLGIRQALSMTNNIEFYRYQVKFSLHKD